MYNSHYHISVIVYSRNGGSIEEQPDENVKAEWFEALRADDLEKVKKLLKTGQN